MSDEVMITCTKTTHTILGEKTSLLEGEITGEVVKDGMRMLPEI
jgi:hypothetical protein